MSTPYELREFSTQDGSPVEAYRFAGSFKNYLYTSSETEIVLNSETYTPIVIKRRAVQAGTQEDDQLALEIEMPFDTDLVTDYAYLTSPPRLGLDLYRVHRGLDYSSEGILFWKGRVTNFETTGRITKVIVPSIFTLALQGNVPSIYYSRMCNHILYDQRCRASLAAPNTQITTVTVVGTGAITVAADGVTDAYLRGGKIRNLRNGEQRLILGNISDVVSISYPFSDILVGDTVELLAGCDHTFATCNSKFANTANYGGQPYIPTDNPFTVTEL